MRFIAHVVAGLLVIGAAIALTGCGDTAAAQCSAQASICSRATPDHHAHGR